VIIRPSQGHPNQPTLDSSPSAVEAVMPTITLIERPAAGDETELRASSSHWSPGDQLFIVERVLEDQNGNAAGSFVFRGTVVKVFPNDDPMLSFEGNNTVTGRGVINTQGVVRFSQFSNPVTFAIVGGTGDFDKARGTVTIANGQFTYVWS
jgi:hypothetical protein